MSYREVLIAKFQERKRLNPRYSLRAFAKDLKIAPSYLSSVMAGKGRLSLEKGRSIAKILKMPPLAAADFVDMVEALSRSTSTLRKAAAERVQGRVLADEVRTITADEFSLISDWRHLAIWSFMTLPAFDGKQQTIARHFKMNVIEVEDVLRRLERLKMVSVNGKIWAVGSMHLYAGGSVPQSAMRQFHQQLSALGRKSIEEQSFSERHLESAILTIERSRYGEIEQKVANFCRSLVKEYGDQPRSDAVYGLSLQLFKLAQPIETA